MGANLLLDGYLILDRDGVINEDYGYVHSIRDLIYKPKAIEGIQKFLAIKTKIIIVTNQAGIAKGYFTQKEYAALTKKICSDTGISPSNVLMCPHHPNGVIKQYTKRCTCRKPNISLINNFCKEKLKRSIMIGDKLSDFGFAQNIGADFYLMSDSRYLNTRESYKFKTVDSILHLYERLTNEQLFTK